jgi:GNAT superfamily N-acetyltransferase
MLLRRFEPSDLSDVHRLICDTIDASYSGVYPPRAIDRFKGFHDLDAIARRATDGVVVVVEQDGEIVGTGSLVDDEIGGVFVSGASQGSGIGSMLMQELEGAARQRGHTAVRLYVSLPSRGFYEHLGYKVFDEGSLDVGAGEHLDYWQASKDL